MMLSKLLTIIIFLPLVVSNYSPPNYDENKGIALVTDELYDLDRVGAGWYYTWSHYPKPTADNRYVPMSYYGLFDDSLPVDYDGFVLFLNEPNNPAPFGAGIDAITAAARYRDFTIARPKAKLVVGNTSAWSSQWHYDFIHEIIRLEAPLPQYVGLHGYVESWITADNLASMWNNIYLGYKSVGIYPEVWITEFADTTGDTESLTDLMDVIQGKAYITRFAYFTNRYDPTQPYIPDGWHDFNLIEDDGSLSPIGAIYAQR
ncbi:hypothetical protein IH575_03140 [Candidatus Dojkabacteria bacterium]|nr:hypothetical protein [Candidatus Dojkabacteria bacterium]